MPFYDPAALDAALDALWGVGHGSSMPAAFEVGLLSSDPRIAGEVEELTSAGGYARVPGTNDGFWLPSEDGEKVSAVLRFPDPTAAWSAPAKFDGIFVDGVLWDFGPLAEDIEVTEAGSGPAIRLVRRFNERLI